MRYVVSSLIQVLGRGLLRIALVGVLSIASWLSTPLYPSYAAASAPDEALTEIKKDQASTDREEAYKEAAQAIDDPKLGVEKEYEKNKKEYFQDNSKGSGLIEGAKGLVNKVTNNDD